MTDIVAKEDIQTELGVTLSAADLALVDSIRLRVEAAIRSYCRWNITEATYTHFLPAYESSGRRLQLPQPFVTAVASVYEDRQARGGQNAGDFASGSLLTVGTDYWIDYDETAYSREGVLFRYAWEWPSLPRTVKVTYTSGFDSTALNAEFIYVKSAVINETIERFHYRKQRQGTTGISGTVKSERLKDYAIAYETGANSGSGGNVSGLLSSTESDLAPIVFYGRMV